MHISLSRTVILKHHWIESFIASLKLRTTGFRKFMILFGNLKIYCNDERTRTFIGFEIKAGYDSLLRLTDIVDKSLEDFNLPTFYEVLEMYLSILLFGVQMDYHNILNYTLPFNYILQDPSFHMSIAWCVGDYEEELNLKLPQLNSRLQEVILNHHDENWHIYVEYLLCKTGNKYYRFLLT